MSNLAMRQEVQDQQNTAWPEPLNQPLCRKGGIVKVVEAQPNDGDVKELEVEAGKLPGIRIVGV